MLDGSATKVALITGANKGIGKEIARRLGSLGSRGMTVLIGARDPQKGEAAARDLAEQGIDVRPITIDVTDPNTIERAREQIERRFGRLDVLVNNAGVSLERDRRTPSQTPVAVVRDTYETNVLGAIGVTNAMVELMRASPAARIVNVSSAMGSNGLWSDPSSQQRRFAPLLLGYDTSKAALNSATLHYALELADTNIKVNAASPGFVATDLNDHRGQLSVEDEQSVSAVIRLATLPGDGPTGEFHTKEGPAPW
jgi:NAD(P)-dependent dehydrogenase (short-subunit alcohol dehydrogenase family)